jgi:hypothetical protein
MKIKDHPFFSDPDDPPKEPDREIGFLTVFKFVNGKSSAFPNQWLPEDIMTETDLYAQVGPGVFDVVARCAKKKTIIDRVRKVVLDPVGEGFPAPAVSLPGQAAAPPVAQPPPAPPVPGNITFGSIQIPANADPTTSMMLFMLHQQGQQMAQSREDARFYSGQQTMMMTRVIEAIAAKSGAPLPVVPDSSQNFLKGVETAVDLMNGFAEQQKIVSAGGGSKDAPLDIPATIHAVADTVRNIKDLASLAGAGGAGGVPVAVVPPVEQAVGGVPTS